MPIIIVVVTDVVDAQFERMIEYNERDHYPPASMLHRLRTSTDGGLRTSAFLSAAGPRRVCTLCRFYCYRNTVKYNQQSSCSSSGDRSGSSGMRWRHATMAKVEGELDNNRITTWGEINRPTTVVLALSLTSKEGRWCYICRVFAPASNSHIRLLKVRFL